MHPQKITVESHPASYQLEGTIGIVLQPDEQMLHNVRKLASVHARNASYVVEHPHLTLYHAALASGGGEEVLTLERAMDIVNNVRTILQSLEIPFNDIRVFADKFVFYHAKQPYPSQLIAAHNKALDLSQWLNTEATAPATSEGLSLSERERDNLILYGHPLVNDLWQPHITLAFDLAGLTVHRNTSEPATMKIQDVLLVRIGTAGSIQSILQQREDEQEKI